MSEKIDEVVQIQMMEFAESARKALAADAAVLVVAFDDKQSASACDLAKKDNDHLYELLRAIAAGANSVIKEMTGNKVELYMRIESAEPRPVAEVFSGKARYRTDPR